MARLRKAYRLLEELGLGSLLVLGTSNVQYLTGFRSSGSALLLSEGRAELFVPSLDYWRAREALGDEIEVYAASPISPGPGSQWLKEQPHLAAAKRARGRTGVDVGAAGYKLVSQALAKLGEWVDVTDELWSLRAVKEESEIQLMVKALRVTEEAIWKALSEAREGVRDYELASVVEREARRLGAERMAFDTIVAVGANSANPHAEIRGDAVKRGDPIVVDAGAVIGGYSSDMTRTVAVGDGGAVGLLEALAEAVEAALDAVKPGVEAWEPDQAARRALERRGLSQYFCHGLGHGVGIDVHEPPRLAPGEKRRLEPGMVVTIEPGVYIPGKMGARIEEMVLVDKSGARVLNEKPRLFQAT